MLALLAVGVIAPAASGSVASKKTKPRPQAHAAAGNPFQSRGMWIWVLGASNGGSLSSIIAQAHRYGVTTLFIKSSDGSGMWSQFNSSTVSTLEAAGLNVCAWQYVYGAHPSIEAQVGANAVKDGANCLVIDAEGQYEGKYYQAQTYITRLRQLIGTSFPVALAGLPYVDYHPAFPYSVFLGPGGAQYNMPQMYWQDIGTSVDTVYAHTYLYNRVYLRPIYPLGQAFNSPPVASIVRFRQFLHVYGAVGVSWWDWQEASSKDWHALSEGISTLANTSAVPGEASISKGAAGDLVIWAQEHLRAAGETLTVDGGYGKQTVAAVKNFQLAHGLAADGVIGLQTWAALLQYKPVYVQWATRSSTKAARIVSAQTITPAAIAATDTRSAQARIKVPPGKTPVPASALLPAKGNEIPSSLGAGSP